MTADEAKRALLKEIERCTWYANMADLRSHQLSASLAERVDAHGDAIEFALEAQLRKKQLERLKS